MAIEYDKFKKSLKHLELQFENYQSLDQDLADITKEAITESVIQRFETCYDCMWKILKRYLTEELGLPEVPNSPKPVLRLAYENNLFASSIEQWLAYADARIGTSHDYSGEKAKAALELMKDFMDDAIGLYQTMSGGKLGIMTRKQKNIDITSSQYKTILTLLKRYVPNLEVWVYGSRVKWTSTPKSDLDMVVFASKEHNLAVSALKEAFEESDLPFKVDLFVWDEVPEQFHQNIKEEHVVLQTPSNEKNVPSGWKEYKLDAIVRINAATYTSTDNWPFINYLDTGNITENRIENIQHLDAKNDKIPSRAKRKIKANDILYSTVRPNQKHYGIIEKPLKNMLASTGFAVIEGTEGISHNKFLYWFLTQEQITEYLQGIAENSTSAYPSIKPNDLGKLNINLPPLQEQHAIAEILGSLDDKIELNRQMNKTLEDIAQAIFKSWFVDFDPVKYKQSLKANPSPITGEGGHSSDEGYKKNNHHFYTGEALAKAKELRKNMTPAENVLWHYLRNRQLNDIKFRRQSPIGKYIVDFVSLQHKLIIELDGGGHAEDSQTKHDQQRDDFLQKVGFRILRFWNDEVYNNIESVLHIILEACYPHPGPLPKGEREQQELFPQKDEYIPSSTRRYGYCKGLPQEILDLFPDDFVESELGEIPRGWEVKQLGDVTCYLNRGISPKYVEEEGIVVINQRCIRDNRLSFENTRMHDPSKSSMEEKFLQLGDILVNSTGVGTLGRVAQVDYLEERSIVDSHVTIVRANENIVKKKYLGIELIVRQSEIEALGEGSTGQTELSRQRLGELLLILPKIDVQNIFDKIIQSCKERITNNEKESLVLIQVRDSLLPKLISGELRVQDAKTIIEGVV